MTHFSSNSHRAHSSPVHHHVYYALLSIFGCNESADNKGIWRVHCDRIPLLLLPPPLSIATPHGREISHYRYTLSAIPVSQLYRNSRRSGQIMHGGRIAWPTLQKIGLWYSGTAEGEKTNLRRPPYIKKTMQRLPFLIRMLNRDRELDFFEIETLFTGQVWKWFILSLPALHLCDDFCSSVIDILYFLSLLRRECIYTYILFAQVEKNRLCAGRRGGKRGPSLGTAYPHSRRFVDICEAKRSSRRAIIWVYETVKIVFIYKVIKRVERYSLSTFDILQEIKNILYYILEFSACANASRFRCDKYHGRNIWIKLKWNFWSYCTSYIIHIGCIK